MTIDARIASNLLYVLRPQIEQAQALLEAAAELRALLEPPPPPPTSVATPPVGPWLAPEQETQADG